MSYIPMPPQGNDDPANYAYMELQDLARALSESQEFVALQILHVESERPRDGMIVYADGTDWDPGDGVGPYCRISGSWTFLGGSGGGGGVTDHGALTGLADDDHTQYLNTSRHAAIDAADHASGAAADGYVLMADGSGGAAWEQVPLAGDIPSVGFIYATAANYLFP